MKTKILSILLTVAMLVAMVPMIAVSAEETEPVADVVDEGNGVYTVNSIAGVNQFLADTNMNKARNTMKLGVDLDYSNVTPGSAPYANGLWAPNNNYLKANVDGNGHTVTIPGGTYNVCVLTYLVADTDYTFKNLKIQMATTADGGQAVAAGDSDSNNKIAEDISLFAGRYRTTPFKSASFTNCYFDVNFKCSGTATSNGSAILFGVNNDANTSSWNLNATNCYFKMHAEVAGGRHGALLGSLYSGSHNTVTMTIVDSVFDVTYTEAAELQNGTVCAALVGHYDATYYSVSDSKGNLSYNNTQLTWLASEGDDPFSSCISKIGADNADNKVTSVAGFQTTDVKDGKFDLRLVGLIDLGETSLTDYSKVGFVVKATHGNYFVTKGTVLDSNKVYTEITANEATGTKQLTAAEIKADADYIFALAITGLPELNEGRTLTLDVMPYYIDANGKTVCGETKTITVTTTPDGDIETVAA